jgi:hypothetical protein
VGFARALGENNQTGLTGLLCSEILTPHIL